MTGRRLTDRAVALSVKRAAELAGLDPARYAGHSLRAGLATSAALAGAEERDIMRQTRHTSLAVARTYIRDGSLFRANVAGTVGLERRPSGAGASPRRPQPPSGRDKWDTL